MSLLSLPLLLSLRYPQRSLVKGALFCFLLLLTACGGATPDPQPVATETIAAFPTLALSETPAPGAGTPTAEAVRAATPRAAPTPQAWAAGGMNAPTDVDWYSDSRPDPLGYLLGTLMHRSLLNTSDQYEQMVSWTVSGKQITFELHEGVTWSDGAPIRAADVADLLQQAVDNGELAGIQRIRADGQNIVVTATGDVCPLLMRVGAFPLVDVRDFPPVRTSGALTVTQAEDGAWEFDMQGASFTYRPYRDENDLRAAWEEGEINAVFGASRLRLGALPGAERVPPYPSNSMAALIFRLGDGTVQPIAVREALALALDRGALYQEAYSTEPPALPAALLSPDHWASPDIELSTNTRLAAELLDGAGWEARPGDGLRVNADGAPLAITLMAVLSPDEQWEALARGIVAQWRALGIDARVQFVESYPLEERLHDGRWQVALVAYHTDPDPDQRALWTPPAPGDLIGQDLNVTGYSNTRVTNLLNQAARVPDCDLTDRAILYQQAWKFIMADKPAYPLFELPLDIVVKSE